MGSSRARQGLARFLRTIDSVHSELPFHRDSLVCSTGGLERERGDGGLRKYFVRSWISPPRRQVSVRIARSSDSPLQQPVVTSYLYVRRMAHPANLKARARGIPAVFVGVSLFVWRAGQPSRSVHMKDARQLSLSMGTSAHTWECSPLCACVETACSSSEERVGVRSHCCCEPSSAGYFRSARARLLRFRRRSRCGSSTPNGDSGRSCWCAPFPVYGTAFLSSHAECVIYRKAAAAFGDEQT